MYELIITGDGKVVLKQAELVDYDLAEQNKGGWKLSEKKSTISQEKIKQLLLYIKKAVFLSLKEDEYYEAGGYGTEYSNSISVTINSVNKSIKYGKTDFITEKTKLAHFGYKALVNLEKQILKITNAKQWIECEH